ncbi:MAG: M20/M25/M40 family metallo-hydrolase [Gemmatimonadales bacterium]|nr:MAG: M20/M25/M40 family metallo-hydrolase [Gemmatimonadales bacterium]
MFARLVSTLGAAVLVLLILPAPSQAQTFTTDDPVLEQLWVEAMENSHLERLGHELMDGVGPRLTGSPGIDQAHDWAVETLQSWGITAENRQYGTWNGWRRGITHIDMIEPRVQSLEGMMVAWSPSTDGPVDGEVVVIPEVSSEAEFQAWLDSEVEGRFVMTAMAPPTCRPDYHYDDFGSSGARQRMAEARQEAQQAFNQNRIGAAGFNNAGAMRAALDQAGAAGLLQTGFVGRPGTNRIFSTNTENAVTLDLSCEDYGLLFRLAEHGSAPVIRVNAEAEDLGEVPVYNTIGVIEGSEKSDEYIMLSAHFDSWDGATGATDNGTGSILMLEVMRILADVYPNPQRTVKIGLWGGEEQGLNGSRRFVADHPDVVENIHVLFNQDNGTGRIANISGQGFVESGSFWGRWLSQVPDQITTHINLNLPGMPSGGGTDHAAFVCAGAPAFNLSAVSWGYNPYTWHTNRDTFDKIVFEEVRNNAALISMLVYLADQEAEPVSRAQRTLPEGRSWPSCSPGRTTSPN